MYKPTKKELIVLGFIDGYFYPTGRSMFALRYTTNSFTLILPGVQKGIYPESIEELKAFIRILTP